MTNCAEVHPPLPPFTRDTTAHRVRKTEDA